MHTQCHSQADSLINYLRVTSLGLLTLHYSKLVQNITSVILIGAHTQNGTDYDRALLSAKFSNVL